MLTFRSLLLTLIKLVLLTSCASTTGIFGDFIREKKSLSYVHDRRAKSDSTLAYLCVAKPRVSYWQMRCSGSVQQIHASSMPLIIFNTWKAEYLYMLGTAGVAEDVSAFVQDAILQESKINSSFKGIKDQTGDKLILEVEIDSIGAIGTYKSEGMVVFAGFFLVSSSNEAGVPGTAFSRFRWQLKRGDNLLASNVVSSSYSSRPWLQEGGKRRALRSFYNANLVEALSKTLKSNIENIVQAVDLYLVEERRGRN